MGAIFIGGGGGKELAASLDEAYKSSILKSEKPATCLYIPHAMKQERHADAYEWFVDKYDFFNEVTLLKDRDDVIMEYSSIYLGGGFCHVLRDTLQGLGMDRAFFQSFVSSGGNLYGGSAGGVVLGKSLLFCREVMLHPEEFVPLQQDGFNVCSDLSFSPHYIGEDSEKMELERLAVKHGLGIVALGEDSGIIFRDNISYSIVNAEHTLQVGSGEL